MRVRVPTFPWEGDLHPWRTEEVLPLPVHTLSHSWIERIFLSSPAPLELERTYNPIVSFLAMNHAAGAAA